MGKGFWRSVLHRRIRSRRVAEIEPDEIFLDSSNLPSFDRHQFEGQLERPISKQSLIVFGLCCAAIALLYLGKVWDLQITHGEAYVQQSENNRLDHTLIFADRGVIYDKTGDQLAWNRRTEAESDFAVRAYREGGGFGHLLGYVTYPLKDTSGNYYQTAYVGQDGVERLFDERLQGSNGLKIVETDALANVAGESIFEPPRSGGDVTLTIDADLQQKLYELIRQRAEDSGFTGGAAVIMDVTTGDLLALTNYPEYRSSALSSGTATTVEAYNFDERKPFLNRAVSGLYTPGSIIKPFVAVAALEEGIISPTKQILSTGALRIENPYNPGDYSVIHDWKAHGYVDLRRALAVSSNVYFFQIGGGFGDQPGLGIERLEKYVRMFGFGSVTGFDLAPEPEGTIPNPAWKKELFNEPWRLGDTYNTSIGQYGFQVTPLQAVRGIAAIANGGALLTPSLVSTDAVERVDLPLSPTTLAIVREGMRMAVTEGTSGGLNMREVAVASKTGTAELGSSKAYVNSWVVGFFPYENPKYAFAVLMEHGPVDNLLGGVSVMRPLLEWMVLERPHYLKGRSRAPSVTAASGAGE